MAAFQLSDDWVRFIKESEALTGIVPYDPDQSTTKRHHEICTIIATASRFLDPRLVNGVITGKYQEFESLMRTGTEGALRGVIPEASQMKSLLEKWISEAESRLQGLRSAPLEERSEFTWHMHDRLICIHPFKTGNGRTARVMFNHLRCLLGLPVQVIRDEEVNEYSSRLTKFREERFLPSLVEV